MIWVAAVVMGLSVLAVFTGVGVIAWRIPECRCDATAFGENWPGLMILSAVIVGSVSTYALGLLTQGAS